MLSKGNGLSVPWLLKKEQSAINLIKSWVEVCNRKIYCSISGGKDSLVTGHLIRRVFPDCPFVWVNQGYLAEWDDCVELIYSLRADGWNIVELCPVRDLWHLYLDYGLPLEGTMNTRVDAVINQKLIYDPLEEYQELNGVQGYAWGIRAQESKGRSAFLKSHGLLYQKKDGLWVCSPVGFWKVQDIWHYIDKYRLPYAAIYDVDRMTVRNGCPIGTTGINWGRLAMLRLHYPDLFERFANAFPEVRNNV